MISLWSGSYKHLRWRESSSSHVIIYKERFHTSDPKAGDIVHVDKSGYFEIIGEPNFNDKNGNNWFEVEIGRRVKTKEVRRRTRQKYQLENLRGWRAMCERNGDTDDLDSIDRHIDMCLEDKSPEAALVGWVRCMENVTEQNLDTVKHLRANEVKYRDMARSPLEADPYYDAQIERYDYMIEAETGLLQWKHRWLCAHAWDCDE